MEDFLKNYPVIVTELVRWGEMDAFGHVNNVHFFRYFEQARIAYLDRLGVMSPADNNNVGPIVATASCKFKAPLMWPDKILVGIKVQKKLSDRITMDFAIFSNTKNIITTTGDCIVVFYDYVKKKTAPIPQRALDNLFNLQSELA